jgi:hypothetical protein
MRFFAVTLADPGGDAAVLEVVAIGLVAGAVAGPLLLKRSFTPQRGPYARSSACCNEFDRDDRRVTHAGVELGDAPAPGPKPAERGKELEAAPPDRGRVASRLD